MNRSSCLLHNKASNFYNVFLVVVVVVVVAIFPLSFSSAFVVNSNGFFARPPVRLLDEQHVTIIRTALSAAGTTSSTMTESVDVNKVVILEDADAVGQRICDITIDAAKQAIKEKGHFYLAIPGGSILKMLAIGSGGENGWTRDTTIAYVNHKCVDMSDGELATHAKAMKLFMNKWDSGCNPIVLDGTSDGNAEAVSYETKLKECGIPVDENGLPVFDLALIGVGDDGHIGSLYPDREEVMFSDSNKWVLPVAMKNPPSITLSLPVMQNAKQVIIAACGVSDKYPQGKSAGMYRAIVDTSETLQSFPAVGLRSMATWIMDKAAASKLGNAYNNN